MQTTFYVKQGPAREVLLVGAQPTPDPGPGEVRVHLKTSGVNPSVSRSSRTAPMSASLIIPHSDGAGDIDRVGSGVVNRIGQRVWVWNGLLRYFVPSFIASGPRGRNGWSCFNRRWVAAAI